MVTVSRMSGGAAGAAAPAGVRAAGHGHASTAVGVGLGVIASQAGAGMTSMVGCLGCAPHSPAQWDGERATSVGLRENSGQARSRRFGNDAATGRGTAFPHCRSRNAGAPGRVIGSPARGVPGPECPPGVRLSGRMRQEDFRSAADVHDRWVVDVDRVELSFGSPLEQGLAFGVCCVEGLDGSSQVVLSMVSVNVLFMAHSFLGDGRSLLPVLLPDWELVLPAGRGLRYPTGACGRAVLPTRSVRPTQYVGCARRVVCLAPPACWGVGPGRPGWVCRVLSWGCLATWAGS